MLVHIVLWNFKSDLSEIEQQEGAKKIKDGLEHLTKSIPEILKIEVGFNALNAPMENHQISLYTEFDSMDSLLIYQNTQTIYLLEKSLNIIPKNEFVSIIT
ncbi:MAG: Dabb family protein [Bacteroidetes bacterium]|nr:Dabb family protein [Bacteroidota bacterium]